MNLMEQKNIRTIIELALAEDIGTGDITAALVPDVKNVKAKIISRQDAIICGVDFVAEVFKFLDANIVITWFFKDGESIKKNQTLCEIQGNSRALLTGERTALNFLQMLSGTATQTRLYVDKIAGTETILLDTRKTIPGLRLAQKYAVTCGGGKNHRLGLYDAILIKENHIEAYGSISAVVNAAHAKFPDKTVEVEVKNFAELEEAISVNTDIIMLDNFTLDAVKEAVKINAKRAKLEVSGGVNLDTIHSLAETGVDYISVGALTKNVVPVDFSMLF